MSKLWLELKIEKINRISSGLPILLWVVWAAVFVFWTVNYALYSPDFGSLFAIVGVKSYGNQWAFGYPFLEWLLHRIHETTSSMAVSRLLLVFLSLSIYLVSIQLSLRVIKQKWSLLLTLLIAFSSAPLAVAAFSGSLQIFYLGCLVLLLSILPWLVRNDLSVIIAFAKSIVAGLLVWLVGSFYSLIIIAILLFSFALYSLLKERKIGCVVISGSVVVGFFLSWKFGSFYPSDFTGKIRAEVLAGLQSILPFLNVGSTDQSFHVVDSVAYFWQKGLLLYGLPKYSYGAMTTVLITVLSSILLRNTKNNASSKEAKLKIDKIFSLISILFIFSCILNSRPSVSSLAPAFLMINLSLVFAWKFSNWLVKSFAIVFFSLGLTAALPSMILDPAIGAHVKLNLGDVKFYPVDEVKRNLWSSIQEGKEIFQSTGGLTKFDQFIFPLRLKKIEYYLLAMNLDADKKPIFSVPCGTNSNFESCFMQSASVCPGERKDVPDIGYFEEFVPSESSGTEIFGKQSLAVQAPGTKIRFF